MASFRSLRADSFQGGEIRADRIFVQGSPVGGAGEIVEGSITADKLATNAVTTDKIAALNVTDAKIAGVSASKITGQIGETQIADGAVTDAKIAGVDESKIVATGITDGHVLTAAGGATTWAAPPTVGTVGPDTITTVELANNAVQTANILDNAVTTVKILDANVIDAKIADVSASKITGQIGETQIADNAVTTAKIADANVTTDKLATDAVTTVKIADANVTAAKISAAAITDGHVLTAASGLATWAAPSGGGDSLTVEILPVDDNGLWGFATYNQYAFRLSVRPYPADQLVATITQQSELRVYDLFTGIAVPLRANFAGFGNFLINGDTSPGGVSQMPVLRSISRDGGGLVDDGYAFAVNSSAEFVAMRYSQVNGWQTEGTPLNLVTALTPAGDYTADGVICLIDVGGNTLYSAIGGDTNFRLIAIDITTPAAPALLGSPLDLGTAARLAPLPVVDNSNRLIICYTTGLELHAIVLNIDNPAAVTLIEDYNWGYPGPFASIFPYNRVAVINPSYISTCTDNHLMIFPNDVENVDRNDPVVAFHIDSSAGLYFHYIAGNLLFVVGGDGGSLQMLRVYDISDAIANLPGACKLRHLRTEQLPLLSGFAAFPWIGSSVIVWGNGPIIYSLSP